MKNIIEELERCILFSDPLIGPSEKNEKRIKDIFKNTFNPETIEQLILSYTGGNKLFENNLKDSNNSGSGHVWDTSIYNNIAQIFDQYVQYSNNTCEYFVFFISKIVDQLEDYNIKTKCLYTDLDQFQWNLIYDLYSSLLKYIKMTNYQRLDLIVRLLGLITKIPFDGYEFYEFIFGEYQKTLPFEISQEQKKEINIRAFFFNI